MMFAEAGCRWDGGDAAITALRAALAQQAEPAQEPVAWRIRCTDPLRDWVLMYRYPKVEEKFSNMEIQPLYTAPPQRLPLTREEAISLWAGRSDGPSNGEILSFARAVERAHGIKE